MNTEEPITDIGPPLVIGLIMLAVGLALPIIAAVWCVAWCWKWARGKVSRNS